MQIHVILQLCLLWESISASLAWERLLDMFIIWISLISGFIMQYQYVEYECKNYIFIFKICFFRLNI